MRRADQQPHKAGDIRWLSDALQGCHLAELTRRRLPPLVLKAFSNGWIVSGWCELRQALRSFRLDRMRMLELASDSFDGIPGQAQA